MELKYIVYIDKQSGKLNRISYPKFNIDPEGVSKSGDELIVHVTEDNMPEGCEDLLHFMSYYWYDPSINEFIFIGEAPNRHATWSNELGGWEFDRKDLINDVRIERNRKLSSTDWTQMADSPLSEEEQIEWQNYRQSLRDVTDNLGVILSTAEVTWPTIPSF
tara:strand:- start:2162 stop:2647 length:486 start_codon:yes stop_codon:yes gene_type:complete